MWRLLIADAGESGNAPAKLFVVRWDAEITNFVTLRVLNRRTNNSAGLLEHVTFAPINLPPQ